VSFLRYPEFDRMPHPSLNYSVKVYLPKAAHSFRDYADSTNPPILHRKETFLDEFHPQYAQLIRLTEREQSLGLLSRPDIGTRKEWEAALAERGLLLKEYDIEER
jgi:DNA phosphorothioation-associated putative methyltransferase